VPLPPLSSHAPFDPQRNATIPLVNAPDHHLLSTPPPLPGTIQRHPHLSFGKYHQHSVDQLIPEMTVIEFFQNQYPNDANFVVGGWGGVLGFWGGVFRLGGLGSGGGFGYR